jgi:NADH:ubiquinone oxidoreductase subunit 5 (subunit L)/multisubunit Na+/H+ antiporter MnhA subunit
MYSLIFFGPVFMFFLLVTLGGRMGGRHTAIAVAAATGVSALLSIDALFTTFFHAFYFTYYLPLFPLIELGWLHIQWHFFLDPLTLFMFGLISVVSFFIQVFASAYMGEDASQVRFMVYLCFFMIAMMLLVGASNFMQLFFGWELVGLASFLLINFWFARQDANAAAFKAMAVNRVGDCFLIFSMFLFALNYNSLDFDVIFCLSSVDRPATVWVAFFCLVVGAFAKSAQFFFHSWLPDAMEGPTPVSALLHSATMVTAGVFLMLRFMDLLEVFPTIRYVVVFFGLLTAFYAMSIAAVADDTKRVTAYTTLNQLGFMFYGCGSLAFATVLFHLLVHGFYKSFSFLTAAIELHDFEDEQDGESDQPEPADTNSLYDILSALVFFSINAIPFSSPSISKEFMLLSGLEKMPDYFTYLVSLVLFSSFVDEGRDDVEGDYRDAVFYGDELHTPSSIPAPMLAGCSGLAFMSICSASFLEEVFLDLNAFSTTSPFFWLDTRGTLLIMIPFFSLLLAEFDAGSMSTASTDLAKRPLVDRSDSAYQAVLFNSELWYYDELVSKFSALFYKFGFWHTNLVMDKAFLEQFYVTLPFTALGATRRFIDQLYELSLERLLPLTIFFVGLWLITGSAGLLVFAPVIFCCVIGEWFFYSNEILLFNGNGK